MPRGDRTGPNGMGPMTGRRTGYCAGYQEPGFMGFLGGARGVGRGLGRGFGRGSGHPPHYPNNPVQSFSPENETDYLKQQATLLEQDLKEINKRLSQIEKTQKK